MPTWPYYGTSLAKRIDLAAVFGRVTEAVELAAKSAMVEVAQEVIDYAKENTVPVELGILKASGTVGMPQQVGDTITVTFGFGGQASAYSVFVHEDLTARHGEAIGKPAGQGAKYLERPVLEMAPELPQRIVDRARAILAQLPKGGTPDVA